MSELALDKAHLPVEVRRSPNVGDMLQAVIEKGVTAENVGAVEKIVELYERMQNKESEKEFARAFNALQAEMPRIQAKKAVPNNDGTVRYKFAPYEEIMEQLRPFLQRHGFTVTFSTRYEETRLVKICTLQHTSGHAKSNEFAVRIGKGPPGASETQSDGAAGTYAKRFALCDALNIVIDKDDDAKIEGASITEEQAAELEARVKATGSRDDFFLKFAGAKSYAEIPSAKYPLLDDYLVSKEKAHKSELLVKLRTLTESIHGFKKATMKAEDWTTERKERLEQWLTDEGLLEPSERLAQLGASRLQQIINKVPSKLPRP